MSAQSKLSELKCILNEVSDLEHVTGLLHWDLQTQMPSGGSHGRGHQLETLTRVSHLKFTSREVGQLLDDLGPYAAELDPDSDDARLIKVTARLYDKRTRLPADFVGEYARITSDAHLVWEKARAEADFVRFQPHLERIVEMRRRYAGFFAPYDHIYDPLLDYFEPGLKTAEVQEIFSTLRPRQIELIRAIQERPQVDDSFLHQYYEEGKQWDYGVAVITKFGYDWTCGRQDKATHPFTQSIGAGDVRITTRFLEDYGASALFSTMHECGHGLYEQGVDRKLDRTPLGKGASLAVHESQSRMYENLIGRSYSFWTYFYPKLQETFPTQLGEVDVEAFYKGINKVEPSFIRVEADEATYNLHIMLRLELEIDLMEGSLEVKDLPDAWNSKMENSLGVRPLNNALGVLQDIHWSSGLIGYFSTYALGNLISVQLWECANQDIPDLDDQIRRGEFEGITMWMREHIHRHGAKFEPQELVQRVTGSKIDPAPYIRYLNEKYGEIYGL
jgi:carboxypeptidase Taq